MRISVIMPLYQGESFLERVLPPLAEALSSKEVHEVLIADDGSTDRGPELCRAKGFTVLSGEKRQGPAAARNRAAKEAEGEVLLFLDADVVMHGDVPSRVRGVFEAHSDCAALLGSYDDAPEHPGWVSQYRNLLHHYTHQRGEVEAGTFWSGCGAIRREIFEEVGGFDTQLFEHASVEDIELGRRLRERGHRVLLCKEIQVKHLKHWTLGNCLFTDIFRRARPWSRMLLEAPKSSSDLNVAGGERVRAVLACGAWAALLLSPFHRIFLSAAALLFGVTWLASLPFYTLVFRAAGWGAGLTALWMHPLYYLYSTAVYAFTWVEHAFRGTPSPQQAGRGSV